MTFGNAGSITACQLNRRRGIEKSRLRAICGCRADSVDKVGVVRAIFCGHRQRNAETPRSVDRSRSHAIAGILEVDIDCFPRRKAAAVDDICSTWVLSIGREQDAWTDIEVALRVQLTGIACCLQRIGSLWRGGRSNIGICSPCTAHSYRSNGLATVGIPAQRYLLVGRKA